MQPTDKNNYSTRGVDTLKIKVDAAFCTFTGVFALKIRVDAT